MSAILDTLVAICCIALGILLMIVGAVLGLGSRIGPWLVRGKYWLIDVLTGRVRVNYRELWILLTGAAGIGAIVCGQLLAGSLVALLGQPLWVMDTWRARAWGKCALSIYFTLAYVVGALRAWGVV